MAITRDAFLGHNNNPGSSVVSLTTSSAVASGALAILALGQFNAAGDTNPSVTTAGGLTWTRSVHLFDTGTGTRNITMFTAPAPSGLASGTTLTITSSGSPDNLLQGVSYLGVGSVGATNTGVGTTNPWSSGTVAAAASSALVGVAFIDGLVGTSAPHTGETEVDDFNNAGQTETQALEEKFNAGSAAITGDWSTAGSAWIAGALELVDAAGGVVRFAPAPRRMPLGV